MFGPEDVIFSYSRAQALADGVLVDLSARYPEMCQRLYKVPVACSAALWSMVQQAVTGEAGRKACNDEAGVVWDLLWMSRHPVRQLSPSTVLFKVIIAGLGAKREFTLKAMVGPGDTAEPVLTLMLPDED